MLVDARFDPDETRRDVVCSEQRGEREDVGVPGCVAEEGVVHLDDVARERVAGQDERFTGGSR